MAVNESFWYIFILFLPVKIKSQCTLVDKSISLNRPYWQAPNQSPFLPTNCHFISIYPNQCTEFFIERIHGVSMKDKWVCVGPERHANQPHYHQSLFIKVRVTAWQISIFQFYTQFISLFLFISKFFIELSEKKSFVETLIHMSPSFQCIKLWNIRQKSNICNETDVDAEPLKKKQ